MVDKDHGRDKEGDDVDDRYNEVWCFHIKFRGKKIQDPDIKNQQDRKRKKTGGYFFKSPAPRNKDIKKECG